MGRLGMEPKSKVYIILTSAVYQVLNFAASLRRPSSASYHSLVRSQTGSQPTIDYNCESIHSCFSDRQMEGHNAAQVS